MYAVIRSGGKQYRVASGETIQVEKLDGKIVGHGRAAKRLVCKFKTGGQYKITRGHRQYYTSVQVSDISLS